MQKSEMVLPDEKSLNAFFEDLANWNDVCKDANLDSIDFHDLGPRL